MVETETKMRKELEARIKALESVPMGSETELARRNTIHAYEYFHVCITCHKNNNDGDVKCIKCEQREQDWRGNGL